MTRNEKKPPKTQTGRRNGGRRSKGNAGTRKKKNGKRTFRFGLLKKKGATKQIEGTTKEKRGSGVPRERGGKNRKRAGPGGTDLKKGPRFQKRRKSVRAGRDEKP